MELVYRLWLMAVRCCLTDIMSFITLIHVQNRICGFNSTGVQELGTPMSSIVQLCCAHSLLSWIVQYVIEGRQQPFLWELNPIVCCSVIIFTLLVISYREDNKVSWGYVIRFCYPGVIVLTIVHGASSLMWYAYSGHFEL